VQPLRLHQHRVSERWAYNFTFCASGAGGDMASMTEGSEF